MNPQWPCTAEMPARSGTGMDVELSLVPQRETGMTPYEIMLSESQERMLLVAKPGREQEVERIFEKWDLHAVRIGKVTDDGMLRVKERGTVVAEIPNRALTDEAWAANAPAVELARDATTGTFRFGPDVVHVAVLVACIVAGLAWGRRRFERRLTT